MDVSQMRFEVDDTVVLNTTGDGVPLLYGRVERTYHALESHDALEDCLIIAYREIPTDIYQQFTASGRPPRGYIFVEFAHEERGHALLPEQSVSLISRALAIGDTVKQDAGSAMFGTIVDVESSYVLSPICWRSTESAECGPFIIQWADWLDTVKSDGESYGGSGQHFQTSHSRLIEQVSQDDLRNAEDFKSGDHVMSRDWLGVVEANDTDVALLLDNQTVVWVERPWELEIILRNPYEKPLVSLPEFDNIRRPDILNSHQNGITSIPPKRLNRGDVVITNKWNLKEGRWLKGQYDPNCLPRGRVLDVRTRRLDITWLVPNAFVSAVNEQIPSSSIKPYENLTSFRNPRDLRRTKGVNRYDHNRKPFAAIISAKMEGEDLRNTSFLQATSNESQDDASRIASDRRFVSTGEVYYPGDRVRFRNPERHTKVSQINSGETYDFDLNEYEIFLGYHNATVHWQDGTITTVNSTSLTPYSLPESDLCPGDLVLAKEGLKMTRVSAEGTSLTSDFNEMHFFERDHTLVPTKVGIIQSVDAQERLARVRWYTNPRIELGSYGQVLQRVEFGQIGEDVEDVSLYEIMTQPALVRKRGDMVVIPPVYSPKPMEVQHSFPAIPADMLAAHPPGPTALSYLRQLTSHVLPALWEIARPFADFAADVSTQRSPVYDWIGEIVDIGLDGSLTVRLGGLKQCKDIKIHQKNVLLIIDENAVFSDPFDDGMDIDVSGGDVGSRSNGSSVLLQSSDESAIDEITEYEGGRRLDNESGEDEWSTDDDTPESSDEAENVEDTTMYEANSAVENLDRREHALTQAVPAITRTRDAEASGIGNDAWISSHDSNISAQPTAVTEKAEVRLNDNESSLSRLAPYLVQEIASSVFEVLEQLPPPDQYNQSEVPTKSTVFLKRIAKEHRILASSLPEGEIYVRTYESRLDLLRCLIIGPADTPYEYCPFVIDLYLGPSFPKEPPKAHFHSWTSGLGRINPNLYEEGKICLSLLGTWDGQNEQERWNDKATLLQLLVSLQGLVFVSKPFYNEAGFETYGDEKVYSLESQQYSEKAYVMARGFAKYALLNAPSGLEDVIAWLYLSTKKESSDTKAPPGLLAEVINRAKQLMACSSRIKDTARLDSTGNVGSLISSPGFLVDGMGDSSDATKTFLKPLSQGALVMLKKIVVALEDIRRYYSNVSMEDTS